MTNVRHRWNGFTPTGKTFLAVGFGVIVLAVALVVASVS